MVAARELRTPTLWLSAALALAVHGGVLLAWKLPTKVPPLIEVEGDSVEVALVEAAPAAPAPEAVPEPPQPEPVLTPPPIEPPPIPPPTPPEMVLPDPPKPAEPQKPAIAPKQAPKPIARPPAPPRTAPGTAGAATAGSGAASGAGKPFGKPAYLVRPAAAYPAESRAAGEQGVVILRVTVNADGRPTAISVARSSGFPRLDRAAVEGGWRCRVSNAAAGAQFDAPVRFNLRD